MKRVIAFIFILMMSFSVVAENDVRVALGGWSTHFIGKGSITNETHNIVGVEYKGYSAGYFKNSYDRDTFFIAKNWRGPIIENWNWIMSAGVNKGYRSCFGDDGDSGKFCPHGYVGVEYDKYRLVHAVKVVPGVIVYSPEIKF